MDILLVDDNEVCRVSLSGLLDALGHTVTTASGGAEALDMLDRSLFSLVITDIQMPDVDGFCVAQRALDRGISFCFTSTLRSEEISDEIFHKASGFLKKPVSIRDVCSFLSQLSRDGE